MAGADAQGPCFCVASCVVRSRAQGGPLRLLRDLHRVGYVSELRFLSCKNTSREVDRPADGQSCSHRESGVLGAQTPLREVHRGQRL